MKTSIIIPARYASSRFPGKPLMQLKLPNGTQKSLIELSWQAAQAVKGVEDVFIATDDRRIAEAADMFGAKVIMTSEQCANGTERCAEAVERAKLTSDLIVNLQGDAPLTPAWFVEKLIKAMHKIIGLITCLMGVFAIIIKGDFYLLINLNFTIGDLWMLAAAIGWALYSIYLFYWKTKLEIFQRFTLIALFGAVSLLPFYIGEEIFFEKTIFSREFYYWVIFAAISPGIIAFTLYTIAQKKLGASLTGFTLYIFTIYGAIYGYFLFEEELENYHLIGTVLVFIGVYLAKKKNVKKN